MRSLAETLKGGQEQVTNPVAAIGQIAAATGLGGIGKTQLANEFVHRYGQYFAGGVFWMSFAEAANVPTEVVLCGGRTYLNLAPDFENLDIETQIQLVRAEWRKEMPRLLVFDNCEDEALLEKWRPITGGCRVLVTSLRATWDGPLGVKSLALGVLSRDESVALLLKFRPDLIESDAAAIAAIDAIAEELDDLPLALHLSGCYLARYHHVTTPADFLARLQDRRLLEHPALQGRGAARAVSPTGHEQHVARTFALSYERLDDQDEIDALAPALLGRTACFAPGEVIPRDLLLRTLDLPEDESEARLTAEDALIRLVDLGLLEAEETGALTLHRLLAAFVESAAPDVTARDAVETTLLNEARRLNKEGYPAPLLKWQPHLRVVTNGAQARGDERGAGLCNELGYHLRTVGDYEGAKPYYKRALDILEARLGPDHPTTHIVRGNLESLEKSLK